MHLFQRLVCYVIGHHPITRTEDDFPISLPIVDFTNVPNTNGFIRYKVLAIPLHSRIEICNRCRTVYWCTVNDYGHLCSLSEIPGLYAFRDSYNRLIWERNERKRNYVANKLYQQYLMALKLGMDIHNTDDVQ